MKKICKKLSVFFTVVVIMTGLSINTSAQMLENPNFNTTPQMINIDLANLVAPKANEGVLKPGITLSDNQFTLNEKIVVNIENTRAPAQKYDWIGLYEEEETPDGNPGSIWYSYLNNLGIKDGKGSFVFNPNNISGETIDRYQRGKNYKFILAYDDGYNIEASQSFSIEVPKVTLGVISDIHIKNSIALDPSNIHFKKALKDINRALPDKDALFIVGDLTDNASDKQYNHMLSLLNEYNSDPTYFAIGNHDVRNLSGGYQEAYDRFIAKTKMLGTHYEVEINGYHFIVLGSDQALSDKAYLSDEQLQWLESKLMEYSRLDQPTFVLLHQPLYQTGPGTYDGDGFGPNGFDGIVQDTELRTILCKYPRTFFITGHTHYKLGKQNTIYKEGNCTMVSLPSVVRLEDDEFWESEGMTLNIYEDRVEFFGRDFYDKEWLQYTHHIIK